MAIRIAKNAVFGIKLTNHTFSTKKEALIKKLVHFVVEFGESGYNAVLNWISPVCNHYRTDVG